jgi:esterase/lipase superfamily enzyme
VHVEERSWWSPNLGQDMALKVYGHAGRAVVAFPSQDGRYWDFEGWGMVGACAGLIEPGRMRVIAVDGIDWQSWTNQSIHPSARARRHDDYDRYLAHEVAPFACQLTGMERAWTIGASMGAYHAANVLFRHPDLFDGLVALSGLYRLRHFIGDYVDDGVYFNSPVLYLPGLNDPWYLDRLRAARLAFVVGQGAWEDEMLEDTREMRRILEEKGIPAIVDEWGADVNHDWPWWRQMLPHYLERLGV